VSTLHERSRPQGVVVTAKGDEFGCLLLTGAKADGSTILEAVPVEALARETPAMAREERNDVLPESTLEVVVHSPEIQDAEPIRSAPMFGTATSSRGGVELWQTTSSTRRQ
jgi:hypothetical protein